MKITIYQIRLEDDRHHLAFMGWSHFQKRGHEQPPANLYQTVYTYRKWKEKPEEVFRRFNVSYPRGYTGRSLSVSDVVELKKIFRHSKFFFCDIFGFAEVSFDKSIAIKMGPEGSV